MLKIAMITPQWLGTKGGPTNYVKNLKLNLEADAHKVSILTSDYYPGVNIFSTMPGLRDIQIIKHLIKISPDIIHIHGRLHYILSAGVYKHIFKAKTKIIFTFHTQPQIEDYLSEGKKQKLPYTGLEGKIGSFLLNHCDVVASVSDSIIKNIKKYCDMKVTDYIVIQSGSNRTEREEMICEAFKKKNVKESSYPILSSIGVFSWDWKVLGHKITIEAINILKGKYPNITLLIAGDGPYREYLMKIVESLSLKDNVVFCGNMEDPSAILHVADFYVHMALNEGSPLAVIEAMRAKKTIIAANKGGIPEIITDGETGILIEPSAVNLANKLIELIENKEICSNIGMNAYMYAVQNLSWREITNLYISIYVK
ncbi:MAG: glycosyltransferase family 4 protein [Syntrophales bacterium]